MEVIGSKCSLRDNLVVKGVLFLVEFWVLPYKKDTSREGVEARFSELLKFGSVRFSVTFLRTPN